MIWKFTKRIETNAEPFGEDMTVGDLLERGLPWIIFPRHHDDYRTVVVFENYPFRFSDVSEEIGVEIPEYLVKAEQPSFEAWNEAVDVARKWCKNRLEIDKEEFDHIVESSMVTAFWEKLPH